MGPKPLDAVFWDYLNHREAKFEGSTGILKRRHLKAKTIIHIGKESEGLDDAEKLGVDDASYQVYLDDKAKVNKERERLKALQSMNEKDAKRIGICRRSMYYWKKKAKKFIC